mgnify:CR=1 FL=1
MKFLSTLALVLSLGLVVGISTDAEAKRIGGGKSSGLMGFLKIGDRAAGAIKSGGTTRRAAKMVICDMDHPDVENFINWKVIEEQKVASLVAGSKAHELKLNEVFAAIREWKNRF